MAGRGSSRRDAEDPDQGGRRGQGRRNTPLDWALGHPAVERPGSATRPRSPSSTPPADGLHGHDVCDRYSVESPVGSDKRQAEGAGQFDVQGVR